MFLCVHDHFLMHLFIVSFCVIKKKKKKKDINPLRACFQTTKKIIMAHVALLHESMLLALFIWSNIIKNTRYEKTNKKVCTNLMDTKLTAWF